jgi:hypothetical protein
MDEFDAFLGQCWTDHAERPEHVVERLTACASRAAARQIPDVVELGAHLFGEHLGRWQEGIDWFARLARRTDIDREREAAIAVRRSASVLKLASGLPLSLDAETASERVSVRALVASALAGRGELDRFVPYLELALSEAPLLQADDPAHRTLAVSANNVAADLEELDDRSAALTELMLAAARAAREHWEFGGKWLGTERAEYRLARSYLCAGQCDRARNHAETCLSLCQANGASGLELFWAHEALVAIARASGDGVALDRHLSRMRHYLDSVGSWVRTWCDERVAFARVSDAASRSGEHHPVTTR